MTHAQLLDAAIVLAAVMSLLIALKLSDVVAETWRDVQKMRRRRL